MSFNEILAGRVRTLLVDEPGVSEQRMFGGLAFMVGGHMAVAVSGQGGVMVRTDPADADRPYFADAEPMVMRGRELAGWLYLEPVAIASDEALAAVVAHGVAFARTLPAK